MRFKRQVLVGLLFVLVVVGCMGEENDERRTAALGEPTTTSVGGLTWRGEWGTETDYAAGDLVTQTDGTWIAIESSVGLNPSECMTAERCAWQLLAAQSGPKGDPGPQGDRGSPGPPGTSLSGWEVVQMQVTAPQGMYGWDVWCPAGKKAISGGWAGTYHDSDPNRTSIVVTSSAPKHVSSTPSAWRVQLHRGQGGTLELNTILYAVCVNA